MDIKTSALNTARWIKKANAKAVFACLTASFIGVSGLWALSLMSEIRNPSASPSSRNRTKQNLPLGVVALADSIGRTIEDNFPSASPFAGAPVRRVKSKKHKHQRTKSDLKALVERLKNSKDKDKAKPAAKRETVSLLYKGVFKRPDGVAMALIEDSRSRKSSFYLQEKDVFGMTLKKISPDSIEILQQDGESIKIERARSAVFVEGKYVP